MTSELDGLLRELPERVQSAVDTYWEARTASAQKQRESGKSDQGLRGAATGGAQMDGFIGVLVETTLLCGFAETEIHFKKAIELPGYFRPTKEWDLLVVSKGRLLVAMETKSQVGPSFGNNFNNRTEEAMGSALDLWTAYREGRFGGGVQPWLGYFFLLEDCAQSRTPVKVREPHFEVFPEFQGASYAKRYELFCRKLKLERQYSQTSLLLSKADTRGYSEPAEDLTFAGLVRSLAGHLLGVA
ncbi:MAG: PaeR7I family type II restriction endonuclease [Fimbriimonadaceae bacterium]|nr:MAG: PaeR7I family type II restriction endonuclease [Fimbriimonadaceae bacterium]